MIEIKDIKAHVRPGFDGIIVDVRLVDVDYDKSITVKGEDDEKVIEWLGNALSGVLSA